MTITEEWRDIPGWEGFYQVSDLGRVKSLARAVLNRPGVMMAVPELVLHATERIKQGSYLFVTFQRDGRKATASVHRLVLLAFVGTCPDDMEGCHRDDDPTNNALSNLRWDTKSENQLECVDHGRNDKSRRTHCPQGHPYDEANTYWYQRERNCRACKKAKMRLRREGQAPVRHSLYKITPEIHADVLARLMSGETGASIARAWGVSTQTIHRIKAGWVPIT